MKDGAWLRSDPSVNGFDRCFSTAALDSNAAHGFDALFIADFPGIYDTYKRSPDAALRDAIAVPLNDPLMAVPAMAEATSMWASA